MGTRWLELFKIVVISFMFNAELQTRRNVSVMSMFVVNEEILYKLILRLSIILSPTILNLLMKQQPPNVFCSFNGLDQITIPEEDVTMVKVALTSMAMLPLVKLWLTTPMSKVLTKILVWIG